MPKPKIQVKMKSYGIYTGWDKTSKDLPVIQKFTEKIPARLGVEFGYVLNIKKAKGKKLCFTIDHPPFQDEQGEMMPPFTGEVYIKTNDWDFFLGDTLWAPVSDKIGIWRLITEIDGEVVADKSFKITDEEGETC